MIRIKVDTAEIQASLAKLRERLANTRPLMREIGDIMVASTIENFEKSGRPKWAPSRAAEARQGKTLINKGFNAGLEGSIHKAYGNNYAIAGTNKRYAAIHQFGGPMKHPARKGVITHFKKHGNSQRFAKSGDADYGMKLNHKAYTYNMTPRPFLKLQPEDLVEINNAAVKYLRENK
jgi:phage virion morphogenesis protein